MGTTLSSSPLSEHQKYNKQSIRSKKSELREIRINFSKYLNFSERERERTNVVREIPLLPLLGLIGCGSGLGFAICRHFCVSEQRGVRALFYERGDVILALKPRVFCFHFFQSVK